jgi:EAL domain-containing protein (putative c-di-GMP-specific phosphodiesterase class I)/FixJ family two-component response regulator
LTSSNNPQVLQCDSTGSLPLLLVIDDDPLFQKQIDFILQGRYRVTPSLQALTGDAEVLTQAETIILDLDMPGVDGLSFIQTISSLGNKPKLLIVSGHDDSVLELARSTAAMYGLTRSDTLRKPVSKSGLLRSLSLLDRRPAEKKILSANVQTFSEEEILAGFRAGQFCLHYQPQVSLGTREVVGIEALVRWEHPELGRISPAHFIDTLEDSVDAAQFTLEIADIAIRDLLRLNKQESRSLKVSINVPPHILQSNTFTEELIFKLETHGLSPQQFQCEITERGLENNGPSISSNLARLRMRGVRLSIDDFGIGQSGLTKVKSKAFDEIKIDRSFIHDLSYSSESRLIVNSIVQLSHAAGLRVVAEGIEDANTLKHSRLLGISNVQGYYFARPMPFTQLQAWLNNWYESDGLAQSEPE